MPGKKSGGGAKSRRQFGVHSMEATLFRDGESQLYGVLGQALGNNRFLVAVCFEDGVVRDVIGIVRGSLRKRVWFANGDLVLASRRDYQDDKVDLIHKYQGNDAKLLNRHQEIPRDLWARYDSQFSAYVEQYESDGVEFDDDGVDSL